MNNIPVPKRMINLVPMEIRAQTERAHYHASQQYNVVLQDTWTAFQTIHWINWFGLFMILMFGLILYLKYKDKEVASGSSS
jgi:hypothetical protein